MISRVANFITAREHTSFQQVYLNGRKWGHEFINCGNKQIFFNGIGIVTMFGHRSRNDIWLLGRIKLNFFCFNEVLYFVLQGPTVISIMIRTFRMICATGIGMIMRRCCIGGFLELLSRSPSWILVDEVILEMGSCWLWWTAWLAFLPLVDYFFADQMQVLGS